MRLITEFRRETAIKRPPGVAFRHGTIVTMEIKEADDNR